MKQIDYFIGIDGGGTKTIGCLISAQGEYLATAQAGPTNYLRKNETQIIEQIIELINTLKSKAGITAVSQIALGIGLSGLGAEEPRKRIRELLAMQNCAQHIATESDAAATLAGAFTGGAGVILIAGTGSIAYGKSIDGKIYRAGGWGYLLGPEGGGFDIGRNGIAAALEDWDGRGEHTILRQKLEAYFKVKSINEAVPEIYVNYATRGALAKFAPLVFTAARSGDKVAINIIENAAKRLAAHLCALAPKLKIAGDLKLALSGNIFKSKSQLLPTMQKLWADAGCQICIVEPQFPAEIGALMLAAPREFKKKQFVENVKKSILAMPIERFDDA